MTKIMFAILVCALSNSSFAQPASFADQLEANQTYRKLVKQAEKRKGSFRCGAIEETLVSNNYSRLPDVESRYSLVVVRCYADPNDGGDSYDLAGLAVLEGGRLVSFTTAYIGQPD